MILGAVDDGGKKVGQERKIIFIFQENDDDRKDSEPMKSMAFENWTTRR